MRGEEVTWEDALEKALDTPFLVSRDLSGVDFYKGVREGLRQAIKILQGGDFSPEPDSEFGVTEAVQVLKWAGFQVTHPDQAEVRAEDTLLEVEAMLWGGTSNEKILEFIRTREEE